MSTLRSRAYAASQLRDLGELVLAARIAAFGAVVPLLMRLPLPRLAALITRPPRTRCPSPQEIARLDRLITLVPRIAHPLVRTGCLTRGVTLFWFLRRAGLDVELRFGLDTGEERETDGHCWLALDGEPYLERRDPRPRFAEFYRLPLAA